MSAAREATPDDWSDAERGLINAMLIDNLGSLPPDPSNKYADNLKAAKLGEKIFNDKRFSANGAVSCANCHRVDYNFTADLPRSQGLELSDRRSMSIMGMAYQRWFFWDGRKDSLWAQALMPVESPVEQGISRTRCTQLIFQYYRDDYQNAIGPLPDIDPFAFPPLARPDHEDPHAMEQWKAIPKETRNQITRVYVNMGKALAAFVRSLNPAVAPFDYYARAVATADEQGLKSLTPR